MPWQATQIHQEYKHKFPWFHLDILYIKIDVPIETHLRAMNTKFIIYLELTTHK